MILSDLYHPLSKFKSDSNGSKQVLECPSAWDVETYADLLSKDKVKQKEAIKEYLAAKIKTDWDFSWSRQSSQQPPHVPSNDDNDNNDDSEEHANGKEAIELGKSGYDQDSGDEESDAASVYSVIDDDYHNNYQPRLDWTSDLSDVDGDAKDEKGAERPATSKSQKDTKADRLEIKHAVRRKALREEMAWNNGLACFEARRAAWTGAHAVRIRPKSNPSIPASSPRGRRRSFFRHSIPGSPPSLLSRNSQSQQQQQQQHSSGDSETSSLGRKSSVSGDQRTITTISTPPIREPESSNRRFPVKILLPIPPPLLPPQNPLRSAISPAIYLTLYDKIIGQSVVPACPINLGDMLRACVAGWQRDGEWPPRSNIPMDMSFGVPGRRISVGHENAFSKRSSRRKSTMLLGGNEKSVSSQKKGFRKSLQKALGIAKE